MNEADRFLQERLQNQGNENCPNGECGTERAVQPPEPPTGIQREVSMGEAWSKFWTTWTFKGRASRSEFWFMILWNCIISFVLGVLSAFESLEAVVGVVSGLWSIAYLIPGLCLFVRRLHDTGRSGWWWWIAFVPIVGAILLLVWECTASEQQTNEYGSVPNLK